MKGRTTSVVICGAGPAGLTLAHLLGQQNVNVTLIERLSETVAEPRAIAIDGESLRTLQQIQMLDGFVSELLQGLTAVYENGKGTVLFSAGSPELKPYGYSTVNSFDQPALDRYLAQGLAARESVSLLFETTLESFEQDSEGVRIFCRDSDGETFEITADYLVGADGGRSTIRSLLKISMSGESNPQPWLVIDTVDPGLDGQLDCHFYCDPARPGMTMRKQHGERRWEWMVMPGESRDELLEDENIRRIISRYTDVSNVEIYRKRVYDFHAIIAERWRDGRVYLVGDAAHMTPPFAGQGLNSGFRDVANLSWKLSAVVNHNADPAILDSYEAERKGHAWELIETALNLGKQIQPLDAKDAEARDALFAEINKDTTAVQALENEIFQAIRTRTVAGGLVINEHQSSAVGSLLMQPVVKTPGGEERLLDEFLGSGFAILGIGCDPESLLGREALDPWRRVDASVVKLCLSPTQQGSGWLIDKHRRLLEWLEKDDPAVLLIRPDRFCMAVANPDDAAEMLASCHSLVFQANDV